MIDFNCFIGAWPFHPLATETLEELQALHKENGIAGGFVSNIKSIFYRDFFYSEEELYNQIKGTSYRQVMTVNPQYPGCLDIVRHGIANWNIAGVRILPFYHHYELTIPELEPLCQLLKEAGLPLFINLSVEDVRNAYLLIPNGPDDEQIMAWLDTHHDNTVVLCGGATDDLPNIAPTILRHPAAFFDISGCRHSAFPFDMLGKELCTRMLYGSMAGILCLKSSAIHMEKDGLTAEEYKRSGEGTAFLAKCPGIK